VLFVSVQELELRKLPFDVDFAVGEIDFGGLRQVGPLHAEGQAELLSNTLGEIRINGNVRAEIEADCDRCLEPVRRPIDSRFELFYRPAPDKDIAHDVAIDAGEAEIGFYDGAGIELAEVLREYVLLSLPMQQVCSEACQGICPQCGLNRNTGGSCQCDRKRVDERWNALRDLNVGNQKN
jgi:uncharacterized metal-binding protein YceD (DUF177 family)